MEGIAGITERVNELQQAVTRPASQGFTQLLTNQLSQPAGQAAPAAPGR